MQTKVHNRNVFVDANIICDYLLNRKYHTMHADHIFEYAQKLSVTLYVCSYSFAIAYHYMRRQKNISHLVALSALEKMFSKVKSIPVDGTIVYQAMKSGFDDYEDAIQYCCALKISECEAIITRDTKDFALSNVPVVTPQTFLIHQKNK